MASKPHGRELDPVRIGFLVDLDVGVKANFVEPFQLAFEEAFASGVTNRRIELVVEEASALPRRSWTIARDGLRRLVDFGDEIVRPLAGDLEQVQVLRAPVDDRPGSARCLDGGVEHGV